jgi:protein-tyrosine phosphatase
MRKESCRKTPEEEATMRTDQFTLDPMDTTEVSSTVTPSRLRRHSGVDVNNLRVDGSQAQRFDAIANFRDIACVNEHSGDMPRECELRRGLVFRSDSLAYASERDLRTLASLDIRTVLDLRRHDEALDAGQVSPLLGAHVVTLPAIVNIWTIPTEVIANNARFLADRYIDMLNEGGPSFSCALNLIVQRPGAAVFHCMAGKDRTGVLAALLLDVLGVDDHRIAADYATTETNMETLIALMQRRDHKRAEGLQNIPDAFLLAPYETMRTFLTDMRTKFGSAAEYFIASGVTEQTVEAWRTIMIA